MKYVDGFVLVVPKKNRAKYKKMASEAGKIWKKFGALEYMECVGDELNPYPKDAPPDCIGSTFSKLTKLRKTEQVWFSFIVYRNKKHRNAVNKKVMAYFTKKYGDKPFDAPFNVKKMCYGGFKAVVQK